MEQYIGLIFGCTKKQEEKQCPFRYLRKIPTIAAIKIWNGLSLEEKSEMIIDHKKCLSYHSNPEQNCSLELKTLNKN